jgi:hypothetical protein
VRCERASRFERPAATVPRLRRPPGGPEEQFLYTRVYVNDSGTWLLAANQIARPSEHERPSGIGN